VVTVDVDRFKEVNDRWGHASGDQVLCAIADALRDAAGPQAWWLASGAMNSR
jgi:diguanylate cyclase (GGDEF)-like protein